MTLSLGYKLSSEEQSPAGRDQKGFFEFYEQEILPRLKPAGSRRRNGARRKGAR